MTAPERITRTGLVHGNVYIEQDDGTIDVDRRKVRDVLSSRPVR
jgi:hypothetical protein